MNGYQAGKGGWVYIMTNPARSVLYTGVTANIVRRVAEHKAGACQEAFTAQYHCTDLLLQEAYTDIRDAIRREKQLKNWKRSWKLELIRRLNPQLRDLAADW